MPDPVWLVRRIVGVRGNPLPKPSLWGVVRASSESVAITKFMWQAKTEADRRHFDAIPAKEKPCS